MDGETGGSGDIYLSPEEAAMNEAAEEAVLSGNTGALDEILQNGDAILHASENVRPIPHGSTQYITIGTTNGAATSTTVTTVATPLLGVPVPQWRRQRASCPNNSSPRRPIAPILYGGLDLATLSSMLGKNPTFIQMDRRAFLRTHQALAFLVSGPH